VTKLLIQLSPGNHAAVDEIFPLIDNRSKRIAGRSFKNGRGEHARPPSAQVHLKSIGQRRV
jgi:hypothetical protein